MRGRNAISDRLAGRRLRSFPLYNNLVFKNSLTPSPPAAVRTESYEKMANTTRTAAVREPSEKQLEEFSSLAEIFEWAGIKGNPFVEYTQAGALLSAVAGEAFIPRSPPTNSPPSPHGTLKQHWGIGS